MCVWQFVGVKQWCRIIVQLSREAGSVPSSRSVALPEKLIGSPTFHVKVERGEEIVGTGGWFPAAIVIGELTLDAPLLSVTMRRTVYVPGVVYVKLGFCAVESPYVPSPFRSQEYVIGSPSGSLDPLPSKLTVSGVGPLVGLAVATAFGGLFELRYLIRWIAPPSKSA